MTEAHPATVTRDWPDIDYYVEVEAHEHWMDFKVFKVIGRGGADGALAFERAGAISGPDPVETTAEANVFLSGSIKWDGCSNVAFDEQDRVMLHFCGKKHATEIGTLMERLYDLAAELVPAWDEITAA